MTMDHDEDQMSDRELAAHFGEAMPVAKKPSEYDIYRVAARVKNEARIESKGNLTPQGEMLCNTFVHVLKAFYDFAETMKNTSDKERLINLIEAQEKAPAQLIAAFTAQIKPEKEEKDEKETE